MDDQFERVARDLQQSIKGGRKVLGEFKTFISKGSAIDLAVGVVIGAAFTTVVQSLVKDVLTPIIALPGTVDFSENAWCLKTVIRSGRASCGVALGWGVFVTTLISFLLTSAAVFFFVVRPVNKFRARSRAAEIPTHRKCPECLSEIPGEARRCSACAQPVGAAT